MRFLRYLRRLTIETEVARPSASRRYDKQLIPLERLQLCFNGEILFVVPA